MEGLDGEHEVLAHFEVFVGYERFEWVDGPWLTRPGETFLVPFELPEVVYAMPGIATRDGVLSSRLHIDGHTASPPDLVVRQVEGRWVLDTPEDEAGRVVPASDRPDLEARVNARLARAAELAALPDGDTGLGPDGGAP